MAITSTVLWFGLAAIVSAQRNPPMPSQQSDKDAIDNARKAIQLLETGKVTKADPFKSMESDICISKSEIQQHEH